MKVHQMKALSQLSFLRTPFQNVSTTARPNVAEDVTSNFRKIPSQLLFDLELEEASESRQSSRPASAALTKLQQAMLPFGEAHSQLLQDAEQAWKKIASHTQGTGTSALAEALRKAGYEACARMAIGGGGGAACLQNLCHRFVTCGIDDNGRNVSYVVDPHFREQFEIARPTASYRSLLSAIPEMVVLTEEQIAHLVQLLCQELGECFKQVGEAVPPWRRPASMASKWKPRQSLDGSIMSMTAPTSMLVESGQTRLARASAAPAVGELSRRLPYKQNDPRASLPVPVSSASGLNQPSQVLQASPFTQLERNETCAENVNMMSDVRRLLAFY